ncbi:integral membrane family protein [Mycoplasmopsis fermentans MF-I2]|nr:YwaF family protein [Mycoplasmopsis fermentans]RMX36067.1 integral membrane family protein [Mycoplasmopsis fermentans MF-I2]
MHKTVDHHHPKGFFSYSGNHLNFTGFSQAFFYIIAFLSITCLLLIWLFHRQIKQKYLVKIKLFYLQKRTFWLLFGLIILLGMVIHIIILAADKFHRAWEYLPFHFCRILMLLIALSLIFNKLHYVKYYGFLAIISGLLALVKVDFNFMQEEDKDIIFPIGIDNWYYWDYLFAHVFVLLMPAVMYALSNNKIRFKDSIFTVIFFSTLSLTMFLINWITYTYSKELTWKTMNYFYLGPDEYNSFRDFMGPLSKWPYNLFTYIFIGILAVIISTIFYCFQDKIYLAKVKNKWVLKWIKSENWKIYRSSFNTRNQKNDELNSSSKDLENCQDNNDSIENNKENISKTVD